MGRMITVGQALIRQKSRLPHGMFLPWIETEFRMSRTSAHRFITVAEVYGSKCSTVEHLEASALYELATPSTPPEIRDRVEEMIVDGEKVTAAQIKRMKAEMRAAQDAASHRRAAQNAKSRRHPSKGSGGVRNGRSRAGNEKRLTKMKASARTNEEHIRCGLHLLASAFADGLRHIALVAKETTALTTPQMSFLSYWRHPQRGRGGGNHLFPGLG